MSIEKYKISEQFSHAEDCQERINTMCANEVSGLGQSRTTFTPEEQAELKARLEGAKTQAERSNIFTSYAKEVGVVVNGAVATSAPVGVDGTHGTHQSQESYYIRGTELERTTSPAQENVPKSSSTTTTKLPAALYQEGKIPPQLTEALTNVASIGQDGSVTLKAGVTEDAFKQALQKYLNEKATSAQLPAEVTFPEGTDNKWKQHLVDEGALREVTTGEGESATKSYTVADSDKLDELTTRIDAESGTERSTQNLDLEFTTITTTEADNVVAPKGLAHDRKARKALQGEYEARLNEWAEENPELRDEALANMKYGKQVDKRMAKMTSGKKGLQTPTEICKKYFDDYATQEEKLIYTTYRQEIAKMKPSELAELYNNMVDTYNAQKGDKEKPLTKLGEADFTAIAGDEYSQAKVNQNIAALAPMSFADSFGATPQSLLRKMAIHDVLADRTKYCETKAEKQQILADDQDYFIKHMAKREVEAKVAEQNVENTTAHWNKSSKKAAEGAEKNNEAIHTDIGKNGRKLVQAYPTQFGEKITDNGHLKEGVDYDYKDTITDPITKKTVTAYFKFSNDKWDEYWDMAADTREDVLQYAKDNHLTLKEARNQMLTRDGGFNTNARRLSVEDTLGNGNGKTGVKELKRYRKLAKTTSRPVDKDYTNWKKTGYALGNGIKDAAIAFTTAGLGDSLIRYAEVVVNVGGETFNVKGKGTGTYTIDETKWVKTTDHYIDKWGTTDVTHETPVNFYRKGTVDVETNTPFTTPEGQKSGKPENRALKTAGGAAAVGGAMGLIRGLATMGKIQDQGTYWDGVINLDKQPIETQTTTKGSVQLITEKPYEVRQGEYSTEKEVDKYKAVTYRGPEAYSGMYRTADGKPVNPRLFAQAYKKATGVNTMTKSFFYAIPELEINGVKFVLKDNADEEYRKIKVGVRGTVQDRAINTPKTGEVHRGKIRRG